MNLVLFSLLQLIYGGGLFAGTIIVGAGLRNSVHLSIVAVAVISNYILLMMNLPPGVSGFFYGPYAAVSGAVTISGYLTFQLLSRMAARTLQRKWYIFLPQYLLLDLLVLLLLGILFVGLYPGS